MGVVRSIRSVVLLVHFLPLITLFLTQMLPLAFGSSLYLPERVKLKFENFDFGTVYSSCEDLSNEIDFVQIRDGQDSKSKELGLYCGYVFTPPDVFSTGRYMWVKFYSNAHNSTYWQGFKAHFEAVELCKYY